MGIDAVLIVSVVAALVTGFAVAWALRRQAGKAREREVALEVALAVERQKAARVPELERAREELLTKEFKLLANDVLRQHGETFTRQNREQLDGVLTPLRQKLFEFQQGLSQAQTESAAARAALGEQIRRLMETSAKMTSETSNLTRALKGKAQTQGAWGELILSTILERSGLREGEEYVTQVSETTEGGARLRPDVVVKLPDGKRIVVDSKVSLTAFEAYVNGATEAERAESLARHVASLRAHIKELSAKDYPQLDGGGLDFAILFVPIEGALAVALEEAPDLVGFAVGLNVALSTPTTLMIALRTVENVWTVERRNRNAEAIALRAGKIYDKFVGFVEDLELVGTRLKQAREGYDDAVGKLSTGKGNLVRQVEQLKELGAKTAKSLPPALAGDEAEEPLPERPELSGS